MRFVIFVIDDQTMSGNAAEMAAIDAFNERLEADGHWITAAGIGPAGSSTLIDNRGGAGESVPGSLVTTAANYSGFWLINAPSAEVAHELAMAGSLACNRKVELRPYLGN
jgi:hypothetical protein